MNTGIADTARRVIRIYIPDDQRGRWVGLIGLALLVAGLETFTALLIFRVLGIATEPGDAPIEVVAGIELTPGALLWAAGITFVIRGSVGVFNSWMQSRVIQSAAANISALVHRRYLQAPYLFHLHRSSSESIRTVMFSVDQAAQNALGPLVMIATHGVITVGLFGLLVTVAPGPSFIALGVVLAGLGLIFAVIQPRLAEQGRRSERAVKNILRSVRDSFDSIRDIKAYRTEDFFDHRFRRHRKALASVRVTKTILEKLPPTAIEFIVIGGLLALVAFARTGADFMSFIPVLGAFGYAALRIVPSLSRVVNSINKLRFANPAVRNVEADLASAVPDEHLEPPPASAVTDKLFNEAIRLESISFVYPGSPRRAVDRASLEIRRGEMVAIVGSSGSGKSTLTDILLRLLTPTEGRLLIDDSDGLPADWHHHVAFVSQSVVLFDGSVRDNVAFGEGPDTDDELVMRALEQACLSDWLAQLPAGLDTIVGEGGKLLSGGERQRVSIARGLYRQPDLLILDEATSALDVATETDLMRSLASIEDLTKVIVSHRLAPMQEADRVALMDDGRITAVGTYADLAADATAFQDLVGL